MHASPLRHHSSHRIKPARRHTHLYHTRSFYDMPKTPKNSLPITIRHSPLSALRETTASLVSANPTPEKIQRRITQERMQDDARAWTPTNTVRCGTGYEVVEPRFERKEAHVAQVEKVLSTEERINLAQEKAVEKVRRKRVIAGGVEPLRMKEWVGKKNKREGRSKVEVEIGSLNESIDEVRNLYRKQR